MSLKIKTTSSLFHITALENLDSILQNDLTPRNYITKFIDIADKEILTGREKFNLGEYTPFHFFSKNPFAGKVQKTFPEKDFIFITIDRQLAINKKFKIIPKHPMTYNLEPLEWEEGFNSIDWELMEKRDYLDHDCKETCMAESIFKGSVPANLFKSIFVKSDVVKKQVEDLLSKYNIRVNVTTFPNMFVNHA